ncbi:flagellar protein [bacterium]|nr:flagellar protein [bacterium]
MRDQQAPATQAPASGLKFSQHAETRIKSRAIPWNEDLERRVSSGLDSAKEKGSRETLILAGDVAVIANVKSRTVITAMDAANLKERIFTNIDSAVIV